MGNCVSQTGHKEFLKSLPATSADSFSLDDPQSFRVFVKKRSKFIPGSLKVTENEIIFARSCTDTLSWPLHYLRRYGFTSAGIFFFESGRRCTSGEGLHTFQSHQAEAIFQLVQSRIQDNANMGLAARDGRAQSVTDSIRSTHSSLSGYTPLGARIHPIQRYSSEGTNGLADYLQPSYSNCDRPSNRFFYHRQAMQQTPKRPRSLATPGHSSVWALSQPAYHPHQYRDSHRNFVGDIVSERVIQRQPSRLGTMNSHSYVNMDASQRRVPSYSLHSLVSNGSFSSPIARVEHKLAPNVASSVWNAVNRSISESNSPSGDRFFYERYVNIKEMANGPAVLQEREVTPPQLDYASVNVGNADDSLSLPARTGSLSGRSEAGSVMAPNVNYAKIDLERTHAVEITANATEKENPHRRHYNACIS